MVGVASKDRAMSEHSTTATAIRLTIDGREVEVEAGSTVWEAARAAGIEIPVLCHDPRLPPVGVCRVCLVDVGEKKLAASCVREASDGMSVTTRNEKIDACRKGLAELLLSDYPADSESGSKTRSDELLALAAEYGVQWPPAGEATDARSTVPLR